MQYSQYRCIGPKGPRLAYSATSPSAFLGTVKNHSISDAQFSGDSKTAFQVSRHKPLSAARNQQTNNKHANNNNLLSDHSDHPGQAAKAPTKHPGSLTDDTGSTGRSGVRSCGSVDSSWLYSVPGVLAALECLGLPKEALAPLCCRSP